MHLQWTKVKRVLDERENSLRSWYVPSHLLDVAWTMKIDVMDHVSA